MASIVVLGCLEETIDTLRYLHLLGGKVDAIVTLTEEQAIKANSTNWFDLRPFALEHGIPIHTVKGYGMKSEEDERLMRELDPEVVLVVGWQRLVPENVIALARSGCIGFHGSCNFLPWGRGRSPINWSIIEGRNRFILHMFQIAPGVDDGDIVGMEVYDITPDDTCRSVYYKTAMAQARLIHRFSDAIRAGRCPRMPQVGTEFHYPKRTPEDGRVDWNGSADAVCRLVRAVTKPYPGAFSTLEGQPVMIWRCQNFGDNLITSGGKPGEVVFVSSNGMKEAVVQTGAGAVLLTEYDSPRELKPGDRFDV